MQAGTNGAMIRKLGIFSDVSVREILLDETLRPEFRGATAPVLAGCIATTAMIWSVRSHEAAVVGLGEAELLADMLTLQRLWARR